MEVDDTVIFNNSKVLDTETGLYLFDNIKPLFYTNNEPIMSKNMSTLLLEKSFSVLYKGTKAVMMINATEYN